MSPSDQNSTNLGYWLLRVEEVDPIFLCCLALWMWGMKTVDDLHKKQIKLPLVSKLAKK